MVHRHLLGQGHHHFLVVLDYHKLPETLVHPLDLVDPRGGKDEGRMMEGGEKEEGGGRREEKRGGGRRREVEKHDLLGGGM